MFSSNSSALCHLNGFIEALTPPQKVPQFERQALFNVLYAAWINGQDVNSILNSCKLYLSRSDLAWCQLALETIEEEYEPSSYELEVFKQQLFNDFQGGMTAKEMEQKAVATKNQYYRELTLKAAQVMAVAEREGRSPAFKMPEMTTFKAVFEEATGIAISGDPGSGKSCFLEWGLGFATQDEVLGPAQIIVMDSHWVPEKWPGLTVIYDPLPIAQMMRYLVDIELEERKQRKRRGEKLPLLIWVLEEAGDIALHCKRLAGTTGDKRWLTLLGDFLVALGSQGRKYEFLGLFVNQSSNTAANGMEGMGDYLEGYLHLRFGRIAKKWSRILGLEKEVVEYIKRQPYPALAGELPIRHPTHACYEIRKKKQPPKPEVSHPICQLPLTLNLPTLIGENKGIILGDAIDNRAFQNFPKLEFDSDALLVVSGDSNDSSDSEADLYALYQSIRNLREQEPPLSKTDIVKSWKMNYQTALQLYDQAIEDYAELWVSDYVENGQLTIRIEDIIQRIWSVTPNVRFRAKFAEAKAKLTAIFLELEVEL